MIEEISPNSWSVRDLRVYWQRVEALVEGQSIEVPPIFRMPPWEDICEQLDWRLHRVDGGYFSAQRHGYRGVYRLIALSLPGDLERPAMLNRVCGQDRTGTLYIGEASNLSQRLNQLRRSARTHRSEGSHQTMSMLRQIPRLNYPPEQLGIALMFTGRHTRGGERDLVRAYMNSFGDTPPLNYKL